MPRCGVGGEIVEAPAVGPRLGQSLVEACGDVRRRVGNDSVDEGPEGAVFGLAERLGRRERLGETRRKDSTRLGRRAPGIKELLEVLAEGLRGRSWDEIKGLGKRQESLSQLGRTFDGAEVSAGFERNEFGVAEVRQGVFSLGVAAKGGVLCAGKEDRGEGRMPTRVDQSSLLPAGWPLVSVSQAVKALRLMRSTSSTVRVKVAASSGSLPRFSATYEAARLRSSSASPVLRPRESSVSLRLESFMGSGPGGDGDTRMRPVGAESLDGSSSSDLVRTAATLPPMEWPPRSHPLESNAGSSTQRVARTSSAIDGTLEFGLSHESPKPGRSIVRERRPRTARMEVSSVQVRALPPSQCSRTVVGPSEPWVW
jgi:hypothetical protein